MAEITREQIALDALDSAINNCGFNPQRFAEATTNWHRYTQNELFKLALCIIRVYGSKSYRHDLRKVCCLESKRNRGIRLTWLTFKIKAK